MAGKPLRWAEAVYGGDELPFWKAWEAEYGLPDAYFSTSMITRAVHVAMTGKDPGPGAYVPFYAPPPERQTPEEAMMIARAHLAHVRKRQG